MNINIGDDILKMQSVGVLARLLSDKTTKKNIMWATDAYGNFGVHYDRNEEIFPELITGVNADMIKTRARKAMELQTERTRQHAEVFTPLWVVKKMNDYADEMWFGYPNVFDKDGVRTPYVRFFENKNTWKDYVYSRRLEITCGEAPYLVSRYDVETGEAIPIEKRIGLLDRKLRVVDENTSDETEWLKWTTRAFQATYGYEFQGDSLLIARVNLLMTFEEYLQNRWGRKPTAEEYKKIANIIAWNLWQMDGLTGTVPYCKAQEDAPQLSLFMDEPDEENTQPLCRIFDWRGDQSVEFVSLKHARA